MDGQPTISSLAERLSGSRRDKTRDKEYRLSKADIGVPIVTTSETTEIVDTPESLGAPSMVLRCVIIQRDGKGYGLTVSGDNPVYVQSVKEYGAAALAGVQQGDRIIKVNGTNVTEYNHIEVVKLIKSGPYVALTLLGPPLQGEQMNSDDIKDNSFYDEKVNTIKKMLIQERNEVEKIKEEYAKDPNKKILGELAVAQKLLQDLEKQLWKAGTGIQQDTQDRPQASKSSVKDTGEMDESLIVSAHETSGNEDKRTPPYEMKCETDDVNLLQGNHCVVQETVKDSFMLSSSKDLFGGTVVPESMQHHNPDIMNFEEDEIAEELNAFQDHGPFRSFETLRTRPAHMAVFINYVFRLHDPCPLLLVLMVEHVRQLTNMKDMVKYSDHICKTYLTASSVLRVEMDEGISKCINDVVHTKNVPEETLRTVFSPAVQHAMREVSLQLQQFCNKREQGLSSVFGEDKISTGMDHNQEVKVLEEILTPLIQDLGQSQGNMDDTVIQKMNAKMEALEKFATHWTGKRKSKITSRIGSMLRPNRPGVPLMRPRTAGSMESIIDDQNKRISILGKWGGKKAKQKDTSSTASLMLSTVLPVVQAAHTTDTSYMGEPGQVSHLVSRFQETVTFDSSDGSSEVADGLGAPSNKDKSIGRSGSFRGDRRSRSTTGKSNSDPDVNTVQLALSVSEATEAPHLSSSASTISVASSTANTSVASVSVDDIISPSIMMDPELDVEPESQWSLATPKEVIKHLDKKECKRQEIINELLHTERHHVRDLLILDLLFYKRMQSEGMLNADELYLVFPNLEEMLRMHRELKNSLEEAKERDGHVVADIADILLSMFADAKGDVFKEECAKYCGNQTAALEFIKERCKKDQKFSNFIQNTERHPICRRLQLKDFVPVEFQRLTKYPLLLENIIKNTKKKDEANKLRTVHKQCKEILNYVNKAVKAAEDHQKIVEIQKNLDASSLNKVNHPIVNEYKNINLVERTLVHQGPLTWRITQTEKKKSVVLHCVLFEDIMVLLQKQDERYVLKCHTSTALNSSRDEKSTVQPPILKLSKVIVRNVATDKRAFFVVSMSEFGPQIYELVAMTTHETQEWLKIVSSTAELAKKKDVSNSHTRRDGFMVVGSSKSPSSIMDATEEQSVAEGGLTRLDNIGGIANRADDAAVLQKIKEKHKEISVALNYKHNLLAHYVGIEPSQLENVLDMSQNDMDLEAKTIALRSLINVQKLSTELNDVLTPDTVFLRPQAPIVVPTQEESSNAVSIPEVSCNSLTQQKADVALETPNIHQSEEVDWSTHEVTPDRAGPPTLDLPIPTTDMVQDNASMDFLMSDYETASEQTSGPPSVIDETPDDSQSNGNAPVNFGEDANIQEGNLGNDSMNIDMSLADAGIGMSETRNNADSDDNTAVDTISLERLVSPAGSVDLLDFGEAIAPPAITVSSSPVGSTTDTDVLLARLDPLSVTRMLDITRNLETQLLTLLESLEKSEREKQVLMDENRKLSSHVQIISPQLSVTGKQDGNLSQDTSSYPELSECATALPYAEISGP